MDYDWKEAFYNGEINPAIPWLKKSCSWIVINMPDLSFLTGKARIASNIAFAFFAVTIISLLNFQFDLWSLFLQFTIIGAAAFFLYSRTVAYASLKAVEKWEFLGEAMFK